MKETIGKKTILFDYRSEMDSAQGDTVLLYDDGRRCYYQTTISQIIGICMDRIEKGQSEMKKEFGNLRESLSSSVESQLQSMREEMSGLSDNLRETSANLVSEQKAFIADSAKTNEALINLVQASASAEGDKK